MRDELNVVIYSVTLAAVSVVALLLKEIRILLFIPAFFLVIRIGIMYYPFEEYELESEEYILIDKTLTCNGFIRFEEECDDGHLYIYKLSQKDCLLCIGFNTQSKTISVWAEDEEGQECIIEMNLDLVQLLHRFQKTFEVKGVVD